VAPVASDAEIRAAYRRMAMAHHPDARGESSSPAMARINEAWRVLSDPGRRAMYDASLRSVPPDAGSTGEEVDDLDDPAADEPAGHHPLGRLAIPLPWIAVLVVLAGIFVFTAYAASRSSGGSGGVLEVGSCVHVVAADVVEETPCSSPHEGRVGSLPPVGTQCPNGQDAYRDRKSVLLVCVVTG
jgi:curved DNA-binding protein CbpA